MLCLNYSINNDKYLYRLLCACRSERVLYTMLVGQFQSNLCDYQCLHPIHNVLSQEVMKSLIYLRLPFLYLA